MTFLLQILAVIALIYNGLVSAALIGWIIKCVIAEWRDNNG